MSSRISTNRPTMNVPCNRLSFFRPLAGHCSGAAGADGLLDPITGNVFRSFQNLTRRFRKKDPGYAFTNGLLDHFMKKREVNGPFQLGMDCPNVQAARLEKFPGFVYEVLAGHALPGQHLVPGGKSRGNFESLQMFVIPRGHWRGTHSCILLLGPPASNRGG